ncbi:hypothetical protein [Kitasatospora sp. NPDC001527]|uniref:hypothetical protein n=1 Tax=Kitasatospora sp. NPDC001527 TaxID=3154519 RepID=UPI00331CA803
MSLPRPLSALTAVAVTTALTLGGAQLAAASPAPPATAAPPASADVPLSAVGAAAQPPTDEQLRAALLTAAELGPDFTEIPLDTESPEPEDGSSPSPSPSPSATPLAGCDALRALLNGTVTEELPSRAQSPYQEVQFEGPDGYPLITEFLTAEESGELAADLDTVDSAFTECPSIDFSSDTGESVTFTVTPVALGDRQDAPAVRLDGTLAGTRLVGYLGIERLGDVALGYGYFQQDSDDAELASLYYRAAVTKAERTLGLQAGSTTAPGTAA